MLSRRRGKATTHKRNSGMRATCCILMLVGLLAHALHAGACPFCMMGYCPPSHASIVHNAGEKDHVTSGFGSAPSCCAAHAPAPTPEAARRDGTRLSADSRCGCPAESHRDTVLTQTPHTPQTPSRTVATVPSLHVMTPRAVPPVPMDHSLPRLYTSTPPPPLTDCLRL